MLPSDSIISSQMMQGNPQKEEATVASEGMEESKRRQLSMTTHLTMIRSQLRVIELHLYLFHSCRVFSGKLPTPQSLNICTAEMIVGCGLELVVVGWWTQSYFSISCTPFISRIHQMLLNLAES